MAQGVPKHAIKGERWEIARGAEGYPAAFEALGRPPKVLYVVGNPEALRDGLAVVGARNATPYGRNAARLFAGCAARRGIPVVSGGARGCDAFAHEAALEAGGVTVAFLGGGCDWPYPVANAGLFERIAASGGAVVSEYPWDVQPRPYGFRARNRLIAGLARATLVVEAGVPSGTFSTADEALAANKDVLAVPGSIFSPTSRGSNALIGQGAMPVVDEESFGEMLDRLFPEAAAGTLFQAAYLEQYGVQPTSGECAAAETVRKAADAAAGLDKRQLALLAALRADPMRLEQIADAFEGDISFDSTSDLMGCVGRLEATGLIERFPDGRFGAVE